MKRLLIALILLSFFSVELIGQMVSPPLLFTPSNNFIGTSIRPRLDWGNVTGANGYLYQVDTSSNFNSPVLINGTHNSTLSRIDLPTIRYGTKYYWRVAAKSATDTSGWSVVRAFTTIDQFGLFFPTNNATTITTSPTISWSSILWSTHYIYEVDETPLFNGPNKISGNTAGLTGISARRANLSGLRNGQDYFWRVAAVSPVDTSSWSVVRKFTTLFLLTTPPTQISPSNGAVNIARQSTILDWTTVTGASEYHVQVDSINNFTSTFPITTVSSAQYTLPQLSNFTTYYWRVRASNALGNSPWSSVRSFTTEDCITNDTLKVNACSSYQLNGTFYTSSGFFTQTLTNSRGCDSTIHLDLTINLPSNSSLTRVACDRFVLNNQIYLLSGNYTQTLQNTNGCDSIISLNLTILNNSVTPVNVTTCQSYFWANTGITYTNSTVDFDTLQSSTGCDSVIILNLVILPSTSSLITATACNSFIWRGDTLTQTGIYNDTISNAIGCDSILILDLSIHPVTQSLVNLSACGSYTWSQNGQSYTTTGSYSDTTTNSLGCDSIITLNLIIDSTISNTISRNGFVLSADQGGANYQWLDCNNGNTPIAGATFQTYTVTANGNYAVEITQNSCVDTSACVAVLSVGIEKFQNESTFSLFPNPANRFITIHVDKAFENEPFEILSLNGKQIQLEQLRSNKQTIDVSKLANGVYFIRFKNKLTKFVIAK